MATAAAEIISQRRRDTERAVSKKTSLRCRDSVFHGRDDRAPCALCRAGREIREGPSSGMTQTSAAKRRSPTNALATPVSFTLETTVLPSFAASAATQFGHGLNGKSAAAGPSAGKLKSLPFSASVTTRPRHPKGSKAQLVGLAPGTGMTSSTSPSAATTFSARRCRWRHGGVRRQRRPLRRGRSCLRRLPRDAGRAAALTHPSDHATAFGVGSAATPDDSIRSEGQALGNKTRKPPAYRAVGFQDGHIAVGSVRESPGQVKIRLPAVSNARSFGLKSGFPSNVAARVSVTPVAGS